MAVVPNLGPFADDGAFIHGGSRVDIVIRYSWGGSLGRQGHLRLNGWLKCGRKRLAVFFEAVLCGLQYLKHAQPLMAVGAWRTPVLTTLQEMLAFLAQRLAFRNHHEFAGNLIGCGRLAVLPVEMIPIHHQLLGPGLGVIKDGHPFGPDHGQLLLLERVEPGDINVGADAAGKTQGSHRGIRHAGS